MTIIYTMLTCESHSKKLHCSEHTMLLNTSSPPVTLGHPLLFPPYLLRFTQLLLTEKATYCHQLSPVTGLPLQQQESQALHLTPHNCLAPAPISDTPFLLGRILRGTSLPTRRIPMPFSLESYKAFKDLCKGKSCSHTPAHSRGLSIQSIYLKHPTVTLRLSCFSSLLRRLVHKQTKHKAHKASVHAINTMHTQILRWFLLQQFQVFKCKGY